ncbi:MAG TPA: hypothetical protein VFE53_01565 [Mucilaginibacter sp.]|nr:hypothetical protein [Mucilaginibacter sp.]
MKRYILFLTATLLFTAAKAQSGYNYQEWGAGAGAFYERGYTNITQQNSHIGFNINAVYNYNPYLPVEAEIQIGQLSGGGRSPQLDPYGRQYTNNYKAIIFHADFQLGAGIDYSDSWILNIVKNFYSGTGFGFISNTNKVTRYSIYQSTYRFPGVDNSIDLMIPLRFGYEFKIFNDYNEPQFAIDLGYVHTIAFGEGLDGYNDPSSKFKNNAPDQYRQITIMFKYFFGNVVSYNKLITPFR